MGLGAWAMVMTTTGSAQYSKKTLVAHRGASAYAPEHTIEAYTLAMQQGADYVEQDLAVTKDGVLVCIHDLSLERTTNVEEVFPTRFIEDKSKAVSVKRWFVGDFTLAEIKQLDAVAAKDFRLPFGTDTRAQFRLEAFNLLNRANFRGPNGVRSSNAFGTITQTYDARQLQIGLKVTF